MAKQNNELLIKNHEAYQNGPTLFLEVNALTTKKFEQGQSHGHGKDHINYHNCGGYKNNKGNHKIASHC